MQTLKSTCACNQSLFRPQMGSTAPYSPLGHGSLPLLSITTDYKLIKNSPSIRHVSCQMAFLCLLLPQLVVCVGSLRMLLPHLVVRWKSVHAIAAPDCAMNA